jgi:hypothetical protein
MANPAFVDVELAKQKSKKKKKKPGSRPTISNQSADLNPGVVRNPRITMRGGKYPATPIGPGGRTRFVPGFNPGGRGPVTPAEPPQPGPIWGPGGKPPQPGPIWGPGGKPPQPGPSWGSGGRIPKPGPGWNPGGPGPSTDPMRDPRYDPTRRRYGGY